jgi:hypothetical protein
VLSLLPQFVREYTDFSFEGKKVKVPYCIVAQLGDSYDSQKVTRTSRFKHYAGKGNPEEIKKSTIEAAARDDFNLKNASSREIHQFMLNNGIGIDCSGFVYNVLDRYLWESQRQHLGRYIRLFPGIKGKLEQLLFSYKRIRRCSAKTLTSDLNTIEITRVKDMQPGDMIRFTLPTWAGKHIAILTQVNAHQIIYAHSGERSKQKGPHTASILILNSQKDLSHQEWLEKHEDGSEYKSYAFHPEKGDSVRRLRQLPRSQSFHSMSK